MAKNKQNVDQPAVDARKLNPIIRPNPNCKACKGKGVGDPVRRAIVACPKCKTNIPAPAPSVKPIKETIKPTKEVDKKPVEDKKSNKKVEDK